MEIKSETIEVIEHKNYLDYEKAQLICDIDQGETVVIQVKDNLGNTIKEETYTPKFINSNFCFTWQDKSLKSETPVREWKLVMKE